MRRIILIIAMISLVLNAALFGFFYAWICSTMWGLDATDPRIAIKAMQAMNASVRNTVFAPAFFGSPIALAMTALLLAYQRQWSSALSFACGAGCLCCAFLITTTLNVPMNQSLAAVQVPDDLHAARIIWQNYSEPWQFWNQIRTLASGIALLLALIGFRLIKKT